MNIIVALDTARHILELGWHNEPKVFDGREHWVLDNRREPSTVYAKDAVYMTAYHAIWRGFWLQTHDTRFVEDYLGAYLRTYCTNPRTTRYAPHPALLNAQFPMSAILSFSVRATKLQCLDLIDDLRRELRHVAKAQSRTERVSRPAHPL